jgi:ATP-dependent DNA ligase
MKLPTLYKRTKTGAITQWTIEAKNGATRTHHGQVGGKIVTSEWYISEATNVGRSNARDIQEQAEFEAKALWKKREEKNYFTNVKDVDKLVFREPMRANKWADANKGKRKVEFPVFVQPKLDGMRATIDLATGARSRGNKEWLTAIHIVESLAPVFKKYPFLKLDGELYCDKYAKDFNAISKLIKRTKPTAQDLKNAKEHIRFHWYDICDEDMNFGERYEMIRAIMGEFGHLLKDTVVMVETHIADSLEYLMQLQGQFLEESYEGAMVRLDAPYEFARTWSILKMKEFVDEEFLIVDIIEGGGNKTGMAVKCMLKFHDGRIFPSTIKGQFPFLKEIWKNKKDYIGKQYATCKYFELTPVKEDGTGGIPKFSNCDRFRPAPSVD